jgi:hypothetical protein
MKVLVCEDDMIAQKVIQSAMEQQNAEGIGVSDGQSPIFIYHISDAMTSFVLFVRYKGGSHRSS